MERRACTSETSYSPMTSLSTFHTSLVAYAWSHQAEAQPPTTVTILTSQSSKITRYSKACLMDSIHSMKSSQKLLEYSGTRPWDWDHHPRISGLLCLRWSPRRSHWWKGTFPSKSSSSLGYVGTPPRSTSYYVIVDRRTSIISNPVSTASMYPCKSSFLTTPVAQPPPLPLWFIEIKDFFKSRRCGRQRRTKATVIPLDAVTSMQRNPQDRIQPIKYCYIVVPVIVASSDLKRQEKSRNYPPNMLAYKHKHQNQSENNNNRRKWRKKQNIVPWSKIKNYPTIELLI